MNESMIRIKGHVRITGDKVKRGKIRAFSGESRKRLFDTLNTISTDQPLPLFITLTFGQSFPSCKAAYALLRLFVRRLETYHGGWVGIVWRGDLQWERGAQGKGYAPHFHLLAFCPFTPKDWISSTWGEVVGNEYCDRSNGESRPPFTRVESIKSWRGVKWYVGKYLAKVDQKEGTGPAGPSGPEGPVPSLGLTLLHNGEKTTDALPPIWDARSWGILNREAIKWDKLTEYGSLPPDKAGGVLRLVKELGHLHSRQSVGGITWYPDESDKAFMPAILKAWKEQREVKNDSVPF